MQEQNNTYRKMWLIYDGDCPVCGLYVNKIRIDRSIGELVLINARYESALLDEVTKEKLNLDNGMVLKIKDRLYYDTDVVNILAILGTRNDLFNKLNYYLFGNKMTARIIYPICKFFRKILLFILHASKINNLEQ